LNEGACAAHQSQLIRLAFQTTIKLALKNFHTYLLYLFTCI